MYKYDISRQNFCKNYISLRVNKLLLKKYTNEVKYTILKINLKYHKSSTQKEENTIN